MQSEELKPCPFCGGSDVRLRHHQAEKMSWVSCVGCGLEAPTETGVSEADAVAYWNRRAEAALSTHVEAAPAGYRWTFDGGATWHYGADRTNPIRSELADEIQPLFAAPPAPFVAVKALLDEVWNAAVEKAAAIADDCVHLTPDPGAAIKAILDGRAKLYPASEAALSAQVQDVAIHRHKKRGSEYALIGIGKMQAENWRELIGEQELAEGDQVGTAVDMRQVSIYRSIDNGSLWVRPIEEFNDGRFEPIPAAPAAKPEEKP